MKAAIVDDLSTDRKRLSDILNTLADEDDIPLTLYTFASGEELLSGFIPFSFDVIFLDMYMHGIGGIEVAHSIRRQDKSVRLVFVTISSEFAIESYRVDCSFYLVKPFLASDVREAILHCRLQELETDTIQVMVNKIPVTLRTSSIMYAERTKAAYRSIRIFLKNGSYVDTRMTFEIFSSLLLGCNGFCLYNRSAIVNLAELSHVTDTTARLKNGHILMLSRSKAPALKEAYAKYLFARTREEK